MNNDFENALNNFVEAAQGLVDGFYNRMDFDKDFPRTKLEVDPNGRKYVRIVSNFHGQRSVYCFVEKSTGNVLKAAGWSAPAKHARGNIYDVNPVAGCSAYGAKYLR